MGQKIKLQTFVHIFTKTDGFYRFYISQGSVATKLRCSGMFSNQFITNFPQNAPVKKFSQSANRAYLAKIWTKVCGLLFWPPCMYEKKFW